MKLRIEPMTEDAKRRLTVPSVGTVTAERTLAINDILQNPELYFAQGAE